MPEARRIRVYPVERGRIKRVLYKVFPYEEVAEELRTGREVLVEGISRQLAWYAAKKLSRMLGREVAYARGVLEMDELTVAGYAFFVEEGNRGDEATRRSPSRSNTS